MIKEPAILVTDISNQIRNFTDIAVIGVSGGADSTLISCLCVKALGADNVFGIHMPYDMSDFDNNRFNANSIILTSKLKIKSKMIFIGDTVNAMAGNFKNTSTLNLGNIKARARMMALYSTACDISESINDLRVRVIGTGNMSEDFIGYDTKGGDALADVFPIGQLFKSEVYQLLDYFTELGMITTDIIDRTPSAGLWEGQTDEDELGYTYNEMEPVIREYLDTGEFPDTLLGKFVMERHFNNKHKHEAPKVFELDKN